MAYRKLVSASSSQLLPEDRFRLYAVAARFPHNLAGQVPWQERQAGVYDRRWGLSAEQIRQYLDQLTAGGPAEPRKPRRKR